MFDRYDAGEQAVLVHIYFTQDKDMEDLQEFESLVSSAGVEALQVITGSRKAPHPKYFVGEGKAVEIAEAVKATGASVVLFDHALSPAQERNLERLCECRVIDRTGLILDIFAQRARTHEGKLQVELAQLRHLATRLVRGWTHLERQKGGIGLRGPGETQIETDRRIIKTKISLLKQKLADWDKQKVIQRKNRGKLTRIALVGYTNVGKSTLMNLLSKSDVFAENKLFATLDTTVRKVVIENLPFLLTDTVGFIRKLPHHLVDSFKTTLDEVRDSDIMVHVVDISHPQFEEQVEVVNKTLQEVCGAGDKEMIMVFNKIDQFSYVQKDADDLTPRLRENIPLEELKDTWMARMNNNCVFISAKTGENVEELKRMLYDKAKQVHLQRFPYNDFLYQTYDHLTEE